MRQQLATADAAMAALAARQHGVVSFGQLKAAGLTASGVARRVRSGRLHRLHRGIYAIGYRPLTHQARWMAAVLAAGESAVVSHRSAAALWGMLAPRSGPVDISVPGNGGRGKRPGIHLHRSRTLTPEQTARRLEIPVTTPSRTVADLRHVASPAEVRRAVRQAGVLGLRVEGEAPERTRSELEQAFLQLCERYDLPMPEVNVKVASLEVDFLWPARRLIVETDGYRFHRGRTAFEDDRNRDLSLRSLGYEVIRLTYRQVTDQSERIATILRQ